MSDPLRRTMPSGTPDPYIEMMADSARQAARMVCGWMADQVKVDIGMVVTVPEDTPGSRMMLCHRPCAPYAHFHWVIDASEVSSPIYNEVAQLDANS